MTQVWPVFGVAPVPSLLSMICKPEAVVMGFFPAVWADASWVAIGVETAAAMAARAVRIIVRREDRISMHLVRETDVSSPERAISIAKSASNGEVLPAIRSPIRRAARKLKVMPLPP